MQLALAGAQALVAPVDRGAQRPLPLREVDRALHLEREALAERPEDLRRGEHCEPGSDELDRERQTIESAADLPYRCECVVLQDHSAGGGELDEQRRRVIDGQRLERVNALGGEAKRRAARREDVEVRSAVEEPGDVDGGGREMLEVVEVQECTRSVQGVGDRVEERALARLADADRTCDSVGDELRIRHRCEPDEVHRPVERCGRRDLECQAALARTAGPVIVTSLTLGSSRSDSMRARASARPTSRWWSAGRLVADSVRSGGNSSRRSGARSWNRCTVAGTSFRRWRPSGRYAPSGTGASPAMSRVARETTT